MNSIDSFEDMTVEELYERLKPIARRVMRGESPTHTFGQATVLVNEVFLRMSRYMPELKTSATARHEVAKQAASAMRSILIDHWRHHQCEKRTGGRERLDLMLVDGASRTTRGPVDLMAFSEVMETLRIEDQLAATVVESRFFGGMSMPEAADHLGLGLNQVENAWARAKKWLAKQLARETS